MPDLPIVKRPLRDDNDRLGRGSMVDKIRILIADDHTVFRQGTRTLLEQEQDMEIVAEAGDGEEAVKLASEVVPDVTIIDVSMPNVDGVEATRRIKAMLPDMPILILSAYDDDEFVFGLMEAGASGYLLKSVHSRELIAAIRAVREGEAVLHPLIARKFLSRFIPSSPSVDKRGAEEPLTEREMMILKMVTRGLSSRAIARNLQLSVRTVDGHLAQIYSKLKVNSRIEAVMRALKEGWIVLDDTSGDESANI